MRTDREMLIEEWFKDYEWVDGRTTEEHSTQELWDELRRLSSN